MNTLAYLGLGANLGDAACTLRQAMTHLSTQPDIQNLRAASLYKTQPVDAQGDFYYNTVVEIETPLSARALLELCHHSEHVFHRTRSYRNAPRTLDIDILLYGTHCIQEEGRHGQGPLIIPHPRLSGRAFVLVPLLELCPSLEIPHIGSVKALLKTLPFSAQAAGLPPSYALSPAPLNQQYTAASLQPCFQYIEKIDPL